MLSRRVPKQFHTFSTATWMKQTFMHCLPQGHSTRWHCLDPLAQASILVGRQPPLDACPPTTLIWPALGHSRVPHPRRCGRPFAPEQNTPGLPIMGILEESSFHSPLRKGTVTSCFRTKLSYTIDGFPSTSV